MKLPDFVKGLTFFSGVAGFGKTNPTFDFEKVIPDTQNRAIFQLQTINVDGHNCNIFFDNGCVFFFFETISLKQKN